MLNEQKIKKMRKLASFESGAGKEALFISKFYRSDYIGLAMIKNFFITTVAYVLLLLIYFGYRSEYLMSNIHKMDLVVFGVKIVAVYVIMLIVYSILTYVYCTVKYQKAQKEIQEYYKDLGQMKKLYDREEKRTVRLTGRRRG